MKKSKKPMLSELNQMAYLMGYDRKKTIFEQQEGHNTIVEARQSLNESVDSQILKEGFPVWLAVGAAGLGVMAAFMRGEPPTDGEKVNIALDRNSWPEIEKALEKISYSAGYNVEDKMQIMSASKAKDYADDLFEAMDGMATDENKIRSVINKVQCTLDMARITYEYGKRDGWTLKQWFTKPYMGIKELSSSEYNNWVVGPIAEEPFAIFEGKQYDDGAAFVEAVSGYVEGEKEEERKKEEESKPKTPEVDFTVVKMNGENMDFDYEMEPEVASIYNKYIEKGYGEKYTPEFLFAYAYDKVHAGDGTDYYIEFPGDGKVTVDIAEGHYGGNKGDESESKRDYAEGGIGRKGGQRVKNVDYGNVKSKEETKTDGGGSSTTKRTARYTLEDIAAGKAVAKKGDKGEVVKQLQNMLMAAGGALPKYGADGDFGNETVAAVKAFQQKKGMSTDGEIGKKTYDALKSGKTTDTGEVKKKEEVVTKKDENEIDKVSQEKENTDPSTIEDQIADLNAQVAKAPTKEVCKTLIASAAAGIKAGVRLKDINSLKQCYNSYNFGLGAKTRKVKKYYGLKGKGN